MVLRMGQPLYKIGLHKHVFEATAVMRGHYQLAESTTMNGGCYHVPVTSVQRAGYRVTEPRGRSGGPRWCPSVTDEMPEPRGPE